MNFWPVVVAIASIFLTVILSRQLLRDYKNSFIEEVRSRYGVDKGQCPSQLKGRFGLGWESAVSGDGGNGLTRTLVHNGNLYIFDSIPLVLSNKPIRIPIEAIHIREQRQFAGLIKLDSVELDGIPHGRLLLPGGLLD